MRRLFTAGITLGVLVCVSPAASASLPTIHKTVIIPGQAVGDVQVGASLEDADARWGGTCSSSVECVWDGGRQGRAQIAVTGTKVDFEHFGAGRVQYIALDYLTHVGHHPSYKTPLARFRTAKGIGIGSSTHALLKAYPRAKREPYMPLKGPGRVFYALGLGLRYCSFITYQGRVAWIATGVVA